MPPPSKRRKRAAVIDNSDDDDVTNVDNNYPPTPPAKQNPKPATRTSTRNTIQRFLLSSPENSPQKSQSGLDLEESIVEESPSPVRKRSRNFTTAPFSTQSKSPIKTRAVRSAAGKKAQEEEKGKSGDLRTLFSKQAERNSTGIGSRKTNGTGIAKEKPLEVEDIISDPIDDDDMPLVRRGGDSTRTSTTQPKSIIGLRAQKRYEKEGNGVGSGGSQLPLSQISNGSLGAGGARFLSKNKGGIVPGSQALSQTQQAEKPRVVDDDPRPWSEKYGPVNLEELAVHKKKVSDVRKWIEDVYGGRLRQRLLILKGAAGTGKTTTLRLLAQDLKCEVLEWRNPNNSFGAIGQAYQSAASQFEEFLGRGGKFGQLDVEEEEEQDMAAPPPPPIQTGNQGSGKRLILLEEFPNTFVRSSVGLVSFRNAIIQYLAANMPAMVGWGRSSLSADPITPIVMVISETLLTTASASADSFTAHRLLGPEILRHPGTAVIEFNPVAPTLLAKALEAIVQKEARKSGRRRTPGPLVLQRLGEIGDIRSAVSSLEFLCVKGDDGTDWGSKVTLTKTKRSKEVPNLTKGERDSLELVSQREATLGIFHAVGKVVYNKRGGKLIGEPVSAAETLPSYMAHFAKPNPSLVSVDTLMDETGTDTHTFISALHENYPLSCEQTSPLDENSSLDYINGCLDYLSEADLLCPSWDIFFGRKGYGGGYTGKDSGSHVLRQDEMAFQVAVRGLLFSLPSPVKRQSHSPYGGGRGNDAHKMFYPTYLKLWRTKEELEGLTDLMATKMLKGEYGGPDHQGLASRGGHPFGGNHGASAFRKTTPLGTTSSQIASSARHSAPSKPEEHHHTPLLSLGNAARQELLLERLPYMAHIARRQRSAFCSSQVKELEKIVTFKGIGRAGADEEDGADAADEDSGVAKEAATSWATDKPTEEMTPRKKRRMGLGAILHLTQKAGHGEEEMQGLPMESLVISDDDIEDD
ncbi:Rad17 cell cycle checkpoint protein-domain-containing protein [Triangularia verruculosa]|uniref:Rad17 cell cycle checkpoint protein-domain-containing protein n=1 Tax=Triangularia verruculosa TaxID=2587418 RepID=A0AAN6XB68_9PEZI|nr:Rad17 cell cycle checkpoint protein-domain-containing protein [Triangularia verruculosa]